VRTSGHRWRGPAEPVLLASTSCAPAKETPTFRPYDVSTPAKRRDIRLNVRLAAAGSEALDFLALRWETTRSDIVRSMIVGAALAQLDRLDDELDAAEPSFDALADAPSIDDVLAGS
jgi:hypothetical protein